VDLCHTNIQLFKFHVSYCINIIMFQSLAHCLNALFHIVSGRVKLIVRSQTLLLWFLAMWSKLIMLPSLVELLH
jgi:hypothetical protein